MLEGFSKSVLTIILQNHSVWKNCCSVSKLFLRRLTGKEQNGNEYKLGKFILTRKKQFTFNGDRHKTNQQRIRIVEYVGSKCQ